MVHRYSENIEKKYVFPYGIFHCNIMDQYVTNGFKTIYLSLEDIQQNPCNHLNVQTTQLLYTHGTQNYHINICYNCYNKLKKDFIFNICDNCLLNSIKLKSEDFHLCKKCEKHRETL